MSATNEQLHVAYFITPHGFGHAARACAVMEALHRAKTGLFFEVFTTIPEWFFRESLDCNIAYHPFVSDVGLIQKNSMQEDISGTLQHLNNFYPFSHEAIEYSCRILKKRNVKTVLCDISPIAINIADECNLPSVLIENFTWDWIYEGYSSNKIQFNQYIDGFKKIYSQANFHIQTIPVCTPDNAVDLKCAPVSRAPREKRELVREKLGLNNHQALALVTMGGIPGEYSFARELTRFPQYQFIIPGASKNISRQGNVILLPHHSNFYHPDLVNASDLVIGKVGYSTLAETYHANIPFIFLSRKSFRESACLANFVHQEMVSMEITEGQFQSIQWIGAIPDLMGKTKRTRSGQNGANQIAKFLLEKVLID
jgi:UDP:flavonoid glycosyltransferase YjiC (YdhE family)